MAFGRSLWLGVRLTGGQELEPRTAADPAHAPSIVGGYADNDVAANVAGATIAGGGRNGSENRVSGDYGTAGGGADNNAQGAYATVGGGIGNTAGGDEATVGGGRHRRPRQQRTSRTDLRNERAGRYRHEGSHLAPHGQRHHRIHCGRPHFSTIIGVGEAMASARSEGRPGDDALITDTSIDDAVVDNENYAYWVFARIRVPASDCSLRTVRITYTVRSPLP